MRKWVPKGVSSRRVNHLSRLLGGKPNNFTYSQFLFRTFLYPKEALPICLQLAGCCDIWISPYLPTVQSPHVWIYISILSSSCSYWNKQTRQEAYRSILCCGHNNPRDISLSLPKWSPEDSFPSSSSRPSETYYEPHFVSLHKWPRNNVHFTSSLYDQNRMKMSTLVADLHARLQFIHHP